jgi:hypothetical protein
MSSLRLMRGSCWRSLALLLLGASAVARAADAGPVADYFGNTLIWKNLSTQAVGRLWLDADGTYHVFYNLGPQARPPDINGPFQVEGRLGTYTVRDDAGPLALCLWPAAPRVVLGAEKQRELYAEGRCYPFEPRKPGESWKQSADPTAREYKFWFVPGR